MNSDLRSTIEARIKLTFMDILMEQPRASLMDIFEVVNALRPSEGAQPVSAPKAAPARTAPAKAVAKSAPKSAAAKAAEMTENLRTEKGRADFEARVLNAIHELGGANVPARKVAKVVGGNATQVRAGLKRLIDAGLLSTSGQRTGTKYSLTA